MELTTSGPGIWRVYEWSYKNQTLAEIEAVKWVKENSSKYTNLSEMKSDLEDYIKSKKVRNTIEIKIKVGGVYVGGKPACHRLSVKHPKKGCDTISVHSPFYDSNATEYIYQ